MIDRENPPNYEQYEQALRTLKEFEQKHPIVQRRQYKSKPRTTFWGKPLPLEEWSLEPDWPELVRKGELTGKETDQWVAALEIKYYFERGWC